MNRLKLTHKVPIVAFDNVLVKMKSDGSFHVLFSQYTVEDAKLSEADVVAAVTVPNEAKWQQLKSLIDKQLAEAKQKEK